jgi:hypothetical protein
MGLFEVRGSTARWVHGRLIYTPPPPVPRWRRVADGSVPLVFAVMYLSRYGATLANVLAILGVCAVAAGIRWYVHRRRPVRPSEPFEVVDPLVARVRRLLETGRVGDAMLAVEAEQSVTLTDAKLIVDAVQRRIDHERVEARDGR